MLQAVRRLRRPPDVSRALAVLAAAPPTEQEAQVVAVLEAQRAALAARTDLVGDAFEAVGGSARHPVGEQSVVASAGPDKALLLHRIARALAPCPVVELGTAFGISGGYVVAGLAAGGGGSLVSVDAAASRSAVAAQTLAAVGDDRVGVRLLTGLFDDHLDELHGARLVYVDGNHYAAPTSSYLAAALERCAPDAVLLFDDIDGYSAEMDRWWSAAARDRRFAATGRKIGRAHV